MNLHTLKGSERETLFCLSFPPAVLKLFNLSLISRLFFFIEKSAPRDIPVSLYSADQEALLGLLLSLKSQFN